MDKNFLNILFLGDLVGRPGRVVLRSFMQNLKEGKVFDEEKEVVSADFVIANVENASHGFGLTEKNHNDIIACGVDCLTSGNHIWDKKDIFNYIDKSEHLIRPANYPKDTAGVGYRIFEKDNYKICVINLLGRTFMGQIDSPWTVLDEILTEVKEITPNIVIDFHAEATAEKVAFARYASDKGCSALIGTHTHVQTNDNRIINDRLAYITDAGFCGISDGVIGMDYETSYKRFITYLPERFEVAQGNKQEVNGVVISLDVNSGAAQTIKKVCYYEEVSEVRL